MEPYYETKFVDPSDPEGYFAAKCVCAGCGIKPDPSTPESARRGTHYHCDAPECVDYDLCLGCWERGTTNGCHELFHEMSLCHGNLKIREGTSTQPMALRSPQSMMISPFSSPFASPSISPSASPLSSPRASPSGSPRAGEFPRVMFAPAPSSSSPPPSAVNIVSMTSSPSSAPPPSSSAASPAVPSTRGECIEPGCTFFGTASTANRCSSCFKAWSAANPEGAAAVSSSAPPPSSSAQGESAEPAAKPKRTPEERRARQEKKKRCRNCKKKVGIYGVFCECGFKFCDSCRLPERHDCDYDHRSLARERLAEQNQAVSPSKVRQI